MDQATGDHGAGLHLDGLVVDVSLHAGAAVQLHAFAGVDVTHQLTADDHVRRAHLALDAAVFRQRQHPILVSNHRTLDGALDIEATAEGDVTGNFHSRSDQRFHVTCPS